MYETNDNKRKSEDMKWRISSMNGFTVRGIQVPHHLRAALARYVVYGNHPSGGLAAILENDLKLTYSLGDEETLRGLPAILGWLYVEAPTACHGRAGVVNYWRRKQSGDTNDET